MQAVIQQRYGNPEVLKLAEVATPTPAANEVRVRIHASSVTAADTMMRRGTPWYARAMLGWLKPKFPIVGTGFSGVIDSIGTAVTNFAIGQRVYGESVLGAGTNTEFVCVPQHAVMVHSPAGFTDEQLAPVCDGVLTSYYFLHQLAALKSGQRVLINGAAGSLGSAAVQLAGLMGAHVTAVCSAQNHPFVRELGAAEAIDYHTTDFTRHQTYDVIYDAVGKSSYRQCKKALTDSGCYLSPVLSVPLLMSMLWTKHTGPKRAVFAAVGLLPETQRRDLLERINGFMQAGTLLPVVAHRFTLAEAAAAHRLVDTGHRRGNVVLVND